jgi:hypothetical protein
MTAYVEKAQRLHCCQLRQASVVLLFGLDMGLNCTQRSITVATIHSAEYSAKRIIVCSSNLQFYAVLEVVRLYRKQTCRTNSYWSIRAIVPSVRQHIDV